MANLTAYRVNNRLRRIGHIEGNSNDCNGFEPMLEIVRLILRKIFNGEAPFPEHLRKVVSETGNGNQQRNQTPQVVPSDLKCEGIFCDSIVGIIEFSKRLY